MAEPLVVVPKNGLGNRLRAIASATFLGELLRRKVEVLWEPYHGLPLSATEIFCDSGFPPLASGSREDELKEIAAGVPRYLSVSRDLISLRGRWHGEQRYINRFSYEALRRPNTPAIIVAGDFFLPGVSTHSNLEQATRFLRRSFHRKVCWSANVRSLAAEARPEGLYVGVHLRAGDRAGQVPEPSEVVNAAVRLARSRGIDSVYVCSDQAQALNFGVASLVDCGFLTYSIGSRPSRFSHTGMLDAVADFINLRHATAAVGSQRSTFYTEATVALASRNRKLLSIDLALDD